jgi:hypothetical protein
MCVPQLLKSFFFVARVALLGVLRLLTAQLKNRTNLHIGIGVLHILDNWVSGYLYFRPRQSLIDRTNMRFPARMISNFIVGFCARSRRYYTVYCTVVHVRSESGWIGQHGLIVV